MAETVAVLYVTYCRASGAARRLITLARGSAAVRHAPALRRLRESTISLGYDRLFDSHVAVQFSRVTLSMSQAPSTMASTSANFQHIFDAALKAYEKKTKKDLLTHPLAEKLQACNSPDDILAVLQDTVQEFDQSRSERLLRWLNPTINVLFALSAALGGGVGLVGPIQLTFLHPPPTNIVGVLPGKRGLHWCWGPSLGRDRLPSLYRSHSYVELCNRQQRTLKRAMTPSPISSRTLRASSSASSLIRRYNQQTP
jgi:hypothetical protein